MCCVAAIPIEKRKRNMYSMQFVRFPRGACPAISRSEPNPGVTNDPGNSCSFHREMVNKKKQWSLWLPM